MKGHGPSAECRDDAAAEIEARLERSGFDQGDISAEAFVQARELFLILDQLMHSAQAVGLRFYVRTPVA
jgi:hypothetical protein